MAPPQPPSYSECLTTLRPASGAPPRQTLSKTIRSSDGKSRVDHGDTSVITHPSKPDMLILDHAKKEARILPMPVPPPLPPPPQPQFTPPGFQPPAPPPGATQVQDLGKSFIQGEEVEGKRYIIPPPPAPKPPAVTKPAAPGLPKKPQLSKPQLPKPNLPQPPPPQPVNMEEWTSTKTRLPVLSKTTGAFGEQISQFKHTVIPEPNPALFQIPPGYQLAVPPPPPLA